MNQSPCLPTFCFIPMSVRRYHLTPNVSNICLVPRSRWAEFGGYKARENGRIMECKRCGGTDHPNGNWFACPQNLIRRKIDTWDGSQLSDCVITDAVVAGFIDADGYIGTEKAGYLRFQLSQSHQFGLDLLDLLSLYLNAGNVTGPQRNAEYSLSLCGSKTTDIVVLMKAHGVIKGNGDICDEWLGGFFAGDGCVRRPPNGCPSVSIAQSTTPEILEGIQQYLGYGSFTTKSWRCYGSNARDFARRFANFALHKRSDLLAIL